MDAMWCSFHVSNKPQYFEGLYRLKNNDVVPSILLCSFRNNRNFNENVTTKFSRLMLSRSCDQIKRTFFYIIGLCSITIPLIKLQTLRKVLSAAIVTRSKLCDMHYPSQWDIGMRDAKESFNERMVQNENRTAMPICSYCQVVFLNVVVIGSNLLVTGIVNVDTNSLIDRLSTHIHSHLCMFSTIAAFVFIQFIITLLYIARIERIAVHWVCLFELWLRIFLYLITIPNRLSI